MERRKTILICDDEPALRELIRASMDDGYDFAEASDGIIAMELAREVRPDLVIPVGRDQENRRRLEPSAHETQQVERRVVRPVHVLDDDHRRPLAAELVEKGCEQFSARPGSGHSHQERPASTELRVVS